jgi:hypothetical protein
MRDYLRDLDTLDTDFRLSDSEIADLRLALEDAIDRLRDLPECDRHLGQFISELFDGCRTCTAVYPGSTTLPGKNDDAEHCTILYCDRQLD